MYQHASMQQSDKANWRLSDMLRQVAIKASEGRRALGNLLRRVGPSDEHLSVKRDGFPVAILISYQEYRKLVRQRLMVASEQLGRGLVREIEGQSVTEEELLNDSEEANRRVFEEEYGAQIR